eukprot:238516_1
MATNYKVGDKIVLFKKHQEAIVRYVGKTEFAPNKTSYGLELCDTATGDNNGTVDGKKYFKCGKNKGKFVFEKDIKFKIKVIKKTQSSKNVNKTPKKSGPKKRVSVKKLGPRDVGRNDNYNPNTTKSKSKTTRKGKKSTKKSKKKKKKKKGHAKDKTVASQSEFDKNDNNAQQSDSDSYKSGYSGASGYSGLDEGELDEAQSQSGYDENTTQDIRTHSDQTQSDNEDREESEYEDEIDENTLTGKAMLMMKQREKERQEQEEQNTTVMVAMSPKQMNKNDNKLFDEPQEEEDAKYDEDAQEQQEEESKEDSKESLIDDDLPEVPKQKSVVNDFKNYAARRGSVHDPVATQGRDSQSTAMAHKNTDSSQAAPPEQATTPLTGKTDTV